MSILLFFFLVMVIMNIISLLPNWLKWGRRNCICSVWYKYQFNIHENANLQGFRDEHIAFMVANCCQEVRSE